MARDFLALSQTYCSKTDPVLRRRRGAVVAKLKASYKATKGRDDELLREIQKEFSGAEAGGTIELEEYEETKRLYRGLYRWLCTADRAERENALANVRKVAQPVIECLQADGITAWADVLRLSGVPDEEGAEDAEEPVRVFAQTVRANARTSEAGRILAEQVAELFSALDSVLSENEEFKAEVARLGQENDELRRDASEVKALAELAEERAASFEAQLRTAKDSIRLALRANIETLAREHPEISELTTAAERLKKPAARIGAEAIESQLPQNFSWKSDQGRIAYKESFLREILRLPREEQQQVVRHIGMLAEHGPEHGSLHTRKYRHGGIPFSPVPCWASRGADDLRFSWVKNGDLAVYWLWRRGDTRIRQSES